MTIGWLWWEMLGMLVLLRFFYQICLLRRVFVLLYPPKIWWITSKSGSSVSLSGLLFSSTTWRKQPTFCDTTTLCRTGNCIGEPYYTFGFCERYRCSVDFWYREHPVNTQIQAISSSKVVEVENNHGLEVAPPAGVTWTHKQTGAEGCIFWVEVEGCSSSGPIIGRFYISLIPW